MPNLGLSPVDFSTPVGKVRLLIQDSEASNVEGGQGTYLWQSDKEIEALLGMKGGSPERVAIFILRQVAMTPAMQYKKWSSADLSVDGPAITAALRALINDLERSISLAEGDEVADFIGIVPTGAAVSQPALLPDDPYQYRGRDLDPGLPLRII
jgi:hypothetical protein